MNVNNNGCSADATLVWEAPANPVAAVEDQYQFCGGLTLDFNNLSENAEAFYWNFGDGFNGGLSGTSTDVNPTYTFPDTGTYVITLTAEAPSRVQTSRPLKWKCNSSSNRHSTSHSPIALTIIFTN